MKTNIITYEIDENKLRNKIIDFERITGQHAYNENLQKLIPTKPDDPSWYHDYPLCPTCRTYMIYNFEHCPKCGQMLLWSEFTGER